ncbi:MAG: response regulator [Cyclobacteriaceae bacterium]
MSKIKVVLIDDHHLIRSGIKSSLEDFEELEVIGEGSDGNEAIELVKTLSPDVAVIDITMPKKNGIEAVREISKAYPATQCLMLSMHDNQDYILDSLEAGAMGYLLKDTDREEFIKAIVTVNDGTKYFSTDVSRIMAEGYLQKMKAGSGFSGKKDSVLSRREREILALIVNGLNSKEIAEKLGLSVRTVEVHRFNMMKKLEVKNAVELVKVAMKENLV